jgi:hypothetical protein
MGHGDRWEVVGAGDTAGAIAHYLPRIRQSGAALTGAERRFIWPADDERRQPPFEAAPIGLVLHESPFIFCAIVLPDSDEGILMTAYPAPRDGTVRRMVVCDVEENCLGLEGWIHAQTDSEVPISFFAVDYFMHPDRYVTGSAIEVSLSGLAYSMQAATPSEIVVDDPEAIRAFQEFAIDSLGGEPLRINTRGAAMLFPMEGWEPFDYHFQGPLKRRKSILHKTRPYSQLSVTVARDRDDIDLRVLAGDHVLRGELPNLGADVAGATCVMGRLADFDWPS